MILEQFHEKYTNLSNIEQIDLLNTLTQFDIAMILADDIDKTYIDLLINLPKFNDINVHQWCFILQNNPDLAEYCTKINEFDCTQINAILEKHPTAKLI